MPSALVGTYRLQLGPTFRFDDAAAQVPHIASLGVSHLYLSPILEAAAGSTHGYDVVDHARISEVLGGRAAFERLVDTARARGLGIVLDIVPNHMSIADPRNQWWWDVLENGPSARAAHVFDVDWDPPEERLKNVVLVPILGEHRGAVVARGEIQVTRDRSRFLVCYQAHRLPVSPRTLDVILADAAARSSSARLAFLADAFAGLPLASATNHASVERRHRDRVILGELLDEMLDSPPAAQAVDEAVAALNADAAALDAFLDRQNFRLSSWRAARRELDYRRFFDINTLVGLRVEDERVFRATHAFLGELIDAGLVDGLRVDHVDGLADPAAYLHRLRALAGARPIWVEKILAGAEALPSWPIEGTTGYDFIGAVDALFVEPTGRARLAELATELTGEARSFADLATDARETILRDALDAELQRLTPLAATVAAQHRDTRDLARQDLHEALRAIAASFPVYRTYIEPSRRERTAADEGAIDNAVAAAQAFHPSIDPQAFTFLRDALSSRLAGDDAAALVRRFQQLTPPAMAKGIEDTAFYRDVRLVALNEVGGAPDRALDVAGFHAQNLHALERWPDRMLATSTHDTKRSEDARARGIALAEDAEAYATLARRFFDRASTVGDLPPRLVLFVLDGLVAAWPIDDSRLVAFAQKAAREAKVRTSWTRQAPDYEALVQRFAEAAVRDPELTGLVEPFVARLDGIARAISLAWTLLKITSPGVPDFYQGCERYCHHLVDPDNRRPVDWTLVARGGEKTTLVRAALAHRRAHTERFGRGSRYEPLAATGDGADHVIAFLRRGSTSGATLVVAVRWPASFAAKRARTRLVLPGSFRDVLDAAHRVRGEVTLDALLGDTAAGLFEEERT